MENFTKHSSHAPLQPLYSKAIEMAYYQITQERINQETSISALWQKINATAPPNCFLSWPWISTWMDVFPCTKNLVSVSCGDETIGLAIVGIKDKQKALLHQTGIESQDQIWMEYNGFLSKSDTKLACWQAWMSFLQSPANKDYSEFVISGADTAMLSDAEKTGFWYGNELWSSPSYRVDLIRLRKKNQHYIDSLSRNTRYQIRKAMKKADTNITIQKAESTKEALSFLDACAPWHIKRWQNEHKTQSGFSNPDFLLFHRTLIQQYFAENMIHIWKLSVSGKTVAYIYNIIDKNTVFFYLSAIDYDQKVLDKPGLIAHTKLIEWYLENHFDVYDFMGGDAQYKKSLGTPGPTLAGKQYSKPTLANKFKHIARSIKQGVS